MNGTANLESRGAMKYDPDEGVCPILWEERGANDQQPGSDTENVAFDKNLKSTHMNLP